MNVKQSVESELVEETEVLGETLSHCHFVHQKSHDFTWARTLAAAVGSRRLTAWAMARPLKSTIRIAEPIPHFTYFNYGSMFLRNVDIRL
jgi:hypothetical protein